ncbi:MAG: hypothetical protein AABW65_00400 [Nanoarchaeota archaeon]
MMKKNKEDLNVGIFSDRLGKNAHFLNKVVRKKAIAYSKYLLMFFSIFLAYTVIAQLLFTTPSGVIFYSINQTNSTNVSTSVLQLNITINNTLANVATAISNISAINITLPPNISYIANTNLTSENGVNLTNITLVGLNGTSLRFGNTSTVTYIVPNSTIRNFLVNISAPVPGIYNISVYPIDMGGNVVNQTNITLVVNDTRPPSNISFWGSTPGRGANTSNNNLEINVSVTDNRMVNNITIFLSNSTGGLLRTNISGSTLHTTSFFINYTGLGDGNYTVNVTANDTWNSGTAVYNHNGTGISMTVKIDTTKPSIDSLTFSSSTSTFINASFKVSDNLGLNGTCKSSRTGANITGTVVSTSGTREITERDLTCGSSYSYTVTCYDTAGNAASKTDSFSTQGCDSGSPAGSSSTTGPITLKATFTVTEEQVKTGYTQSLGEKEGVKVKVENATHQIGVISVLNDSVVIEVASIPQKVTLKVGESGKFDVTNDTYYDLKVTLNSIVGKKANVTIVSVHELKPVTEDTNKTKEDAKADTGEKKSAGEKIKNLVKGNKTWWVVLGVLVIIAIVFAVIIYNSKRSNS